MRKLVVISAIIFLGFINSLGQLNDSYDRETVVRSQDVMWQKTIWRKLNLKSTSNISFFARDIEFTTMLLKAVLTGKIDVFENDSLNQRLSVLEFRKRLRIPIQCVEESDTAYDEVTSREKDTLYFDGRDVYELELKERCVFDKHRSVFEIQPVSISLYIPYDHPENPYGMQIELGAIAFKDLLVFESKSGSSYWYNPYNETATMSFSSAILLRKFDGHIVKVTNPWNEYLDEYKTVEEAYWSGVRIDNQLREFEYGLWVDHP